MFYLAPSKAAPGRVGCFTSQRLVPGRRVTSLGLGQPFIGWESNAEGTSPTDCCAWNPLAPLRRKDHFLAQRYPWFVCNSHKVVDIPRGKEEPPTAPSSPLNLDYANYVTVWDDTELLKKQQLAGRKKGTSPTTGDEGGTDQGDELGSDLGNSISQLDVVPLLVLPSNFQSLQRAPRGDLEQVFTSTPPAELSSGLPTGISSPQHQRDCFLFTQAPLSFPHPLNETQPSKRHERPGGGRTSSLRPEVESQLLDPGFWKYFHGKVAEWTEQVKELDNVQVSLIRHDSPSSASSSDHYTLSLAVVATKPIPAGGEILWAQQPTHYKQQIAMKLFGSVRDLNSVRWVESVLTHEPEDVLASPTIDGGGGGEDIDDEHEPFPWLRLGTKMRRPTKGSPPSTKKSPILTEQKLILGDLTTRRRATDSAALAWALRESVCSERSDRLLQNLLGGPDQGELSTKELRSTLVEFMTPISCRKDTPV